jgi:hypothetical protein
MNIMLLNFLYNTLRDYLVPVTSTVSMEVVRGEMGLFVRHVEVSYGDRYSKTV